MAEVAGNVSEVLKQLDAKMKMAGEIIGGMAESYAKQYLTDSGAVDTGRLRNSVAHGMTGGQMSITDYADNSGNVVGSYDSAIPADPNNKYVVVVGTNVEYAPYIELGTKKTMARPYLRPAIENHKDEYMAVLKDILGG